MRILAVLVLISFINFADCLVVPPLLGQLHNTFQLTSVRLAAALRAVLPASPDGLNRQPLLYPSEVQSQAGLLNRELHASKTKGKRGNRPTAGMMKMGLPVIIFLSHWGSESLSELSHGIFHVERLLGGHGALGHRLEVEVLLVLPA